MTKSNLSRLAFSPHLSTYLTDDGYRGLQDRLAAEPELGDVMPGTGGFRKLRWKDPTRGKDQRGGPRISYYYIVGDRQIWLITLHDKNQASDLTPKEEQTLNSAIGSELQARQKLRLARQRRC